MVLFNQFKRWIWAGQKLPDRKKQGKTLPRIGADERGLSVIAKIAGIPPQQAKVELAGTPELPKFEKQRPHH